MGSPDHPPGGEIHAAKIATVDLAARTCTVVFGDGAGRSPELPYEPHVAVDDEGAVTLTHPTRDDPACVLEDATGGYWLARWTSHG